MSFKVEQKYRSLNQLVDRSSQSWVTLTPTIGGCFITMPNLSRVKSLVPCAAS